MNNSLKPYNTFGIDKRAQNKDHHPRFCLPDLPARLHFLSYTPHASPLLHTTRFNRILPHTLSPPILLLLISKP